MSKAANVLTDNYRTRGPLAEMGKLGITEENATCEGVSSAYLNLSTLASNASRPMEMGQQRGCLFTQRTDRS